MVQQPHFEHHLREARRNQRRLRLALGTILTGVVGLVAPAYLTFVAPGPGSQTAIVAVAQAAQGADAPATPSNFQALAMDDNAVIALSWAGTADATPAKAYRLERSIDQVNWTLIADSVSELQYLDDKVAFAVHYYYRLTALGVSGSPSPYAFADVATGEFAANSSDTNGGTLSSVDGVARVKIPSGSLTDKTANCSVAPSAAKYNGDEKVVLGPYALVCKTAGGNLISSFIKPVVWTLDVKDKTKGINDVTVINMNLKENNEIEYTYDKNTKLMVFNQVGTTTVVVVGIQPKGISPSLVAMFIFLILLVVGICALVLRKFQKDQYYDHLRKKYDNL